MQTYYNFFWVIKIHFPFFMFPQYLALQAIESEEQQRLRFQVELEFIQCLANPNYLHCKCAMSSALAGISNIKIYLFNSSRTT